MTAAPNARVAWKEGAGSAHEDRQREGVLVVKTLSAKISGKSDPATIMDVIADLQRCPEWASGVKHIDVLETYDKRSSEGRALLRLRRPCHGRVFVRLRTGGRSSLSVAFDRGHHPAPTRRDLHVSPPGGGHGGHLRPRGAAASGPPRNDPARWAAEDDAGGPA